ncbi:MAG: phosphoadenosine phosphosulfate reductase family protein [Mycoplasma sp.]|nr:phosphoadenosine phosphosulfate reductase family protein [Mycoplasma sp.]
MSFNDREIRRLHYKELVEHMPFKDKVRYAKERIEKFLKWCETNFYKNEKCDETKEVLISFSGGKDSTVIFDLIVKVHKEIKSKIYLVPAYAIEITFPETIRFIKDTTEKYKEKFSYLKNPLLVPPKEPWGKILRNRGYPIFSKQISVLINRAKRANTKNGVTKWIFGIEDTVRFKLSKSRLFLLDEDMTYYLDENGNKIQYNFSEKCCDYVKGGLKHDKRPSFVGTMTQESSLRKKSWIENGCNVYKNNHPISRPISLWSNNDVWRYIKENQLEVNQAYGYNIKEHNIDNLIFSRLGCSACPYGSNIEELIHKRKSKNNELAKEKKYWNRYEKLYEYNNILYKSQVIQTKIFYVLIDMDIKIRNDLEYMKIYEKRRKIIDKWYENFRENLLKIMIRIESNKNNKTKWKYTIHEFNKALLSHSEKPTNSSEIKELRKKYSKK